MAEHVEGLRRGLSTSSTKKRKGELRLFQEKVQGPGTASSSLPSKPLNDMRFQNIPIKISIRSLNYYSLPIHGTETASLGLLFSNA